MPSYLSPPLVETALGVQFRPLKGFKNIHLSGFWSGIKTEFPDTEDQEPLDGKIELFGDDIRKGPAIPRVRFKPHASRLQAFSSDRHRMVQMQNGRFVFNWRRMEKGTYPRWPSIFEQFWKWYSGFQQYLSESEIGEIIPIQWEVTYVNHLLRGQEWQLESDWPKLLPGLFGHCTVSEGQLESVDSRVQFLLPNNRGRLYVETNKAALTANPDQELLSLVLTARGPVTTENPIDSGLALGHAAIVTSFAEFTGAEAQQLWKRES